MIFMRNIEIKRFLSIYVIIALSASVGAFFLDIRTGIYVSCICTVLIILFHLQTYQRYMKIKRFDAELDRVLHGDYALDFSDYVEGELSILADDVYKMTMSLRENNERLIKDKKYLADSIADISHQLRTPLTAMEVIASLFNKPELSNEKRMELNRELLGLIDRMEWHINILLKISKIDSKTAYFAEENVNVKKMLIQAAKPLLIPMELRGQRLTIEGDESAEYNGDVKWSVEAAGNILKNCMEHIEEENGEIKATISTNNLYTQIDICDNGTGVKDDEIPHLFERFYQGSNAGQNSYGIGLALAKMIITEQNGTIQVKNNKENGVTFCIRFYKVIV